MAEIDCKIMKKITLIFLVLMLAIGGSGAYAYNEGMLDDLGGPGTDDDSEMIITSLINLHKDVTVEKATKRKGKRYGFYQSDINE